MFHFFGPKVPQIYVEEVKQALDHKKKFVLLDVRTPHEFLEGHITRSKNVALSELMRRVEVEFPDKDETIFVYCQSGSRSNQAVGLMMRLGFTHVYNMTNGLLAWKSKGYELI